MKMGKHSKKRQQQAGNGRAVLVTFYVVRPRRHKDGGGGASAAASRQVHHHHHHHHYHHLHGRGHDETRRRGSDRRADLLEYSRQLRATSATTPTTPHPTKPPLPPRRDIRAVPTVGAVRHDDGHPPRRQPANDDDRRLVRQRRLERAASLPEVRHRCLGLGVDWSWKRVLTLVLPCQNESSTRSKKRRDSVDGDSKKKNSRQAKAWPAAAQLVSKLKVNRTSRRRTSGNADEGLVKKLFSMFRQRSRPSR